jgi:hypothetical protein
MHEPNFEQIELLNMIYQHLYDYEIAKIVSRMTQHTNKNGFCFLFLLLSSRASWATRTTTATNSKFKI